jgi:threonylcarbamoyladenosine tRNA methylthiotransferase MtaB
VPLRLKVVTAGCKSNFADSSAIVREALALGYHVTEGAADVVVVNGCTVTHRADRDSRALARRARREYPGARVVVTGCFAATAGGRPSALPEADAWIAPSEAGALAAFLASEAGEGGRAAARGPVPSVHGSDLLLGHRRTFLKVQDGCNAFCGYCAIPLARGRERSVPLRDAVEAARRAEGSGAREIVLTGIHVGRYGADRGEADGLAALVEALLAATREPRFRLGSVEPLEVTGRLVSIAAADRRLCPHFHVPLQSGSDGVLRRMGRPYGARRYRDALARIREAVPGARIGADVIAGYPGESEDDFRSTLSLVGEGGIDYLHAFPYSPREGTAAARLRDDVPPAEKKRRVALLLAADRRARERDMAGRRGTVEEMIAERFDGATGTLRGTSASYHAVTAPGREDEAGLLLPVSLAGTDGDSFVGERIR